MYLDGKAWAIIAALVAGLFGTAFYVACEQMEMCGTQKPVEYHSTADIYIIDRSTHSTAWAETKLSIAEQLKDPFGAIITTDAVFSDQVLPEDSTVDVYGLANDIVVVAITADSEVLSKVTILDNGAAQSAAMAIIGGANESRAIKIYEGVFSNSTGLWGLLSDTYLVGDVSEVIDSSACEDFAIAEIESNEMLQDAYNYTDQDAAVEKLCGIVQEVTEGIAEADYLYDVLAKDECDRAGNGKCSDIPGAMKQAYEVMEEKQELQDEWNRIAPSGTSYRFGACLYFASDMITYSTAEGDLDVQAGMKIWTPQDAASKGKSSANILFKNGFPDLALGVKVAMPDIGKSTRDNKVITQTSKNLIDEYWESFFDELDVETTSGC